MFAHIESTIALGWLPDTPENNPLLMSGIKQMTFRRSG